MKYFSRVIVACIIGCSFLLLPVKLNAQFKNPYPYVAPKWTKEDEKRYHDNVKASDKKKQDAEDEKERIKYNQNKSNQQPAQTKVNKPTLSEETIAKKKKDDDAKAAQQAANYAALMKIYEAERKEKEALYSYIGPVADENGLRFVKKGTKYGYINSIADAVVQPIYDECTSYFNGFYGVKFLGKWGYVDKAGKTAILCVYDRIVSTFNPETATVVYKGKTIIIDKKGNKLITEPVNAGAKNSKKYEEVDDEFSEGLKAVSSNGKTGFINNKGTEVVPLLYDKARKFQEGLAGVLLNGKWGFIDTKGNTIIPFNYSSVNNFKSGKAKVTIDGRTIYIDKTGAEVKQPF